MREVIAWGESINHEGSHCLGGEHKSCTIKEVEGLQSIVYNTITVDPHLNARM